MTFVLMGRSKAVLMLNTLVKAVHDVGDREHCGFLENPPEVCHPLGWEF